MAEAQASSRAAHGASDSPIFSVPSASSVRDRSLGLESAAVEARGRRRSIPFAVDARGYRIADSARDYC
jgi:hypothetical protein